MNTSHTFGEPKDTVPVGNEVLHHAIWACLNTDKQWESFTDDTLYDIEVRLREWIEEMKQVKGWSNNAKNRRYTTSMLVRALFHRDYDIKIDGKYNKYYKRLFSYYSSKVQKGGWSREKQKSINKTFYTISPKRLNNPPYSLKLRYEYLIANGEIPTNMNMKLPKDDLKPGHARNPRTEANMQLRREEGRRKYNERYANRSH